MKKISKIIVALLLIFIGIKTTVYSLDTVLAVNRNPQVKSARVTSNGEQIILDFKYEVVDAKNQLRNTHFGILDGYAKIVNLSKTVKPIINGKQIVLQIDGKSGMDRGDLDITYLAESSKVIKVKLDDGTLENMSIIALLIDNTPPKIGLLTYDETNEIIKIDMSDEMDISTPSIVGNGGFEVRHSTINNKVIVTNVTIEDKAIKLEVQGIITSGLYSIKYKQQTPSIIKNKNGIAMETNSSDFYITLSGAIDSIPPEFDENPVYNFGDQTILITANEILKAINTQKGHGFRIEGEAYFPTIKNIEITRDSNQILITLDDVLKEDNYRIIYTSLATIPVEDIAGNEVFDGRQVSLSIIIPKFVEAIYKDDISLENKMKHTLTLTTNVEFVGIPHKDDFKNIVPNIIDIKIGKDYIIICYEQAINQTPQNLNVQFNYIQNVNNKFHMTANSIPMETQSITFVAKETVAPTILKQNPIKYEDKKIIIKTTENLIINSVPKIEINDSDLNIKNIGISQTNKNEIIINLNEKIVDEKIVVSYINSGIKHITDKEQNELEMFSVEVGISNNINNGTDNNINNETDNNINNGTDNNINNGEGAILENEIIEENHITDKIDLNKDVTRANMSIILSKMMGLIPKDGYSFIDVASDKYYYGHINIAKIYGIVEGYKGEFFPLEYVTYEDSMVMMGQILKRVGMYNTDKAIFDDIKDSGDISHYAVDYVASVLNSKIVQTNKVLKPQRHISTKESIENTINLYKKISK